MTISSRSSRLRGRVLAFVAAGALASGGAVALLPEAAHAVPPSVRPISATCELGHWNVQWEYTNTAALPATITTAYATGGDSQALAFGPNPVAPLGATGHATEVFPSSNSGVITAHVHYHLGMNPITEATGTWAIGSTPAGMSVVNHCVPSWVQGVTANPAVVYPGTGTHVTGQCEPNASGFVYSEAFVKDIGHEFAGIGAEPIHTGADGSFSANAMISPWTTPGHYTIRVRCGGGTLGATAPLDVIANPNAQVKGIQQEAPTVVVTNPESVRAVPVFTG